MTRQPNIMTFDQARAHLCRSLREKFREMDIAEGTHGPVFDQIDAFEAGREKALHLVCTVGDLLSFEFTARLVKDDLVGCALPVDVYTWQIILRLTLGGVTTESVETVGCIPVRRSVPVGEA